MEEHIKNKTEITYIKQTFMRKIIAKKMEESWKIPAFTLVKNIGIDTLLTYRKELSLKVSITAILAYVIAKALIKRPEMNGIYEDGVVGLGKNVNLGIAMDTPDGLIVPNIFHAESMQILEIHKTLIELKGQQKMKKLTPDLFMNGTFTLTNLGMMGVNSFRALINPPQIGILSIGNIQKQFDQQNGQCQSFMTMTLTADHRAIDGAGGALFIQQIQNEINSLVS